MRDYGRYLIGILFLIGAIVLIVVIFNFIRNIFTGDDARQDEVRRVNLMEEGREGKTVQYTMYGAVVGEEMHRRIRFTIDTDSRRIDILQGYEGEVIKSQEFAHSRSAYDAFIAALNGAGFASTIDPEGRGNESQSCPLGRKYFYEVSPGADDQFRTWSNSCSTNQGTFSGNSQQVRLLFQRQIPEYTDFIRGTQLSGTGL